MRTKRGEGGRRVVIGAAGIALSMIGGVVVGRTAIGDLRPAYSAGGATERPWTTSKPVSSTEYVPVSQPLYASSQPVSAIGSANPYPSKPMLDPGQSAWEQKLSADYVRWQAKLDRDLRTSSDLDAPPAPSVRSHSPSVSQPVALTIASDQTSEASRTPAQPRVDVSPAGNAQTGDIPSIDQAL